MSARTETQLERYFNARYFSFSLVDIAALREQLRATAALVAAQLSTPASELVFDAGVVIEGTQLELMRDRQLRADGKPQAAQQPIGDRIVDELAKQFHACSWDSIDHHYACGELRAVPRVGCSGCDVASFQHAVTLVCAASCHASCAGPPLFDDL